MKSRMIKAGGELLETCPILGICGCSGAGKTTLIEALIPLLRDRGLRVAVVKHDAHNVLIDVPGKDSDRFFRAGADVSLFGEECFMRRHEQGDFGVFLTTLCRDHDLVLVEGHAKTEVPKLWLLGPGFEVPPENRGRILKVLSRDEADAVSVFSWLSERLERKQQQGPVWGCILIGGRSSRMGRPKHLIENSGRTWLEHAVDKLNPFVEQIVLSGRGEVPGSVNSPVRIPDVPGLGGPLAGLLACMRWQPSVSWLVMACDLPDVMPESLQWLLDNRGPGIDAVLPDLEGDGRIEPLLAWYGPRCLPHLEEIVASGRLRISLLSGRKGIIHPRPPANLCASWRNVNTPEELEFNPR
jgi:molybdopterin-guanine dinucleotide biosynthesis protein MobB